MSKIKIALMALAAVFAADLFAATVNLSKLTNDKQIKNNSLVLGQLCRIEDNFNNHRISIADGATITLAEAEINADWSIWAEGNETPIVPYPGLYCEGDATIELEGDNIVHAWGNGSEGNAPGIYIREGHTLTIKGDGSLTVVGIGHAAGIGGYDSADGDTSSCGNIIFEGGTIKATCGDQGPGIGACEFGNCGRIVFDRCNVTAKGISRGVFFQPAIGASVGGKCTGMTIKETIGKIDGISAGFYYDAPVTTLDDNIGVFNSTSGYTIDNSISSKEITQKAINNDITEYVFTSQLGSLSGNKTYKGSSVHLRGALSGDWRISLADGARVLLDDVTIGPTLRNDKAGITCEGDATISLAGTSYVYGCGDDWPAIFVPEGHTLTIQGSGSLVAVGGGERATAIGGCHPDVTVNGGGKVVIKTSRSGNIVANNVMAVGGKFAAALGNVFKNGDGELVANGDGVVIRAGDVRTKAGINIYEASSKYDLLSDQIKLMNGIESVTPEKGCKEQFRWNGNLGVVDSSEVDLIAHDKMTIYGSAKTSAQITVDPGATVILRDVAPKWDATDRCYYPLDIECSGDAIIELEGENILQGSGGDPAILIMKGKTLTIRGEGSLGATGGGDAPGIGGSASHQDCGDIVVENGVITAKSESAGCVAIGAFEDGECGTIEFDGGCTTLLVQGTSTDPTYGRKYPYNREYRGLKRGPGISSRRTQTEIRNYVVNYAVVHEYMQKEIFAWDGKLREIEEEEIGGAKKAMKAAATRDASDPDPEEYGLPLKNVISEAIAGDGTVITGTLSGRHKVSIAHGATVTLRDAEIVQGHNDSSAYAGITCLGDATIKLEGVNYIWAFHAYYPAISVPQGSTLTIEGDGVLYANGGAFGAGIGGGYDIDCGKIVINGGEIHAAGGLGAAGIGGGPKAGVGAIVLNGGIIEATSSTPIGTYSSDTSGLKYVGSAPGVGVGWSGSGASVKINSGVAKLTVKRGNGNSAFIGVGSTGTIYSFPEISDIFTMKEDGNTRTYVWNGSLSSLPDPGEGKVLEVTAFDGTLIRNNTGTKNIKVNIAPGAKVRFSGNVNVNGKTVKASDDTPWAGITCQGDATITLLDKCSVEAYSFNTNYPGIFVPSGSKLTIEGSGSLKAASSGGGGAGIGGGYKMNCGKIVINGGTVKAEGHNGAGVGSGESANCEGITIGSGIDSVEAWCNSAREGYRYVVPVGNGKDGACNIISIGERVNEEVSQVAYCKYRANPDTDLSTLAGDKEVQTGATITGRLEGDKKITIAAGAEVRLSNAVVAGGSDGDHPAIECLGDATIWLEGMNSLTAFGDCSAIYVPYDKTLTIKDGGKGYLYAKGGFGSAGIGARYSQSVQWPYQSWCGNIVIEGGEIVSIGGAGAAGIGAGYDATATRSYSSCGTITITGGKVLAQGGSDAAGIGYGEYAGDAAKCSDCGDITIGESIAKVVAVCVKSADKPIGKRKNSDTGVSIATSLKKTEDGNTLTLIQNVHLENVTYKTVLQDGVTVYGTYNSAEKISIAEDATITLSNVRIDGVDGYYYPWAGISCEGNATIILEGDNYVKGYYNTYPGIYVPEGATLTIKGDGSLVATSNGNAPGIGGGCDMNGGNIVIQSGTIEASCIAGSAAIGGGARASFGDITINGGMVTATGNVHAPAIGSGYAGSCGNIEFGSHVERIEATCGNAVSDPIGAGNGDGTVGQVVVSGRLFSSQTEDETTKTTKILSKNFDLGTLDSDITLVDGMVVSGTISSSYKISVAAGARITLKDVQIPGVFFSGCNYYWAGLTCLGDATITLKGTSMIRGFYDDYPGIYVPEGSILRINGDGKLNASSNGDGAGIGGGYRGSCGTIMINGGTVTAAGTANSKGAGIGSGCFGSCEGICIYGGTVNASGWNGAGIGSGENGACDYIFINGGTVDALGGSEAAGIGSGGNNGSCGDIVIKGGTVNATGGLISPGIGSGYYGSCGDITIAAGIKQVVAAPGSGCTNAIGAGNYGTCGEISVDDILDDVTDANGRRTIVMPTVVDLSTVTANKVFTGYTVVTGKLDSYCKLSIAHGAKVTLKDADIYGDWTRVGSYPGLTCEGDATIVLKGENVVRGTDIYYAGIFVPSGYTLTIKGDGSLEAHSGAPESSESVREYYGAGIGGNTGVSCGNVVIEGGKVFARGGGAYAAAIGRCDGNVSHPDSTTAGTVTIREGIVMVRADGGISNLVKAEGLVESKFNSNRIVVVSPPWDGDFSTFDAENMLVADGTTITGSIEGDATVKIADNATVTLCNAYIEGQLDCSSRNTTIILVGTSRIIAPSGKHAILGPVDYIYSCTVKGNGKLIIYTDTATWLYGNKSLEDGLKWTYTQSSDNNRVYTIAQSPTKEFDAWMSANGISSSDWDKKDESGVPNALRYIAAPRTQEEEEALEDGLIQGFAIDKNGNVTLETLELRNTAGFDIKVIASDDPAGTQNVEEFSLSEKGITSIKEEGEITKRFFRVVIEKK